jgi:hypothetical protein
MTKTANWKDLLHKTIFLVGEIIHGVKAFARTELYLNTQAIHKQYTTCLKNLPF